jgi:hypothetical protein
MNNKFTFHQIAFIAIVAATVVAVMRGDWIVALMGTVGAIISNS